MRSIPISFSSFDRRIIVTPWVSRPICETSATRVRTSVPPSVISIISSSSSTRTAPTCSPLRSETLIEITPMPPRPLIGNCSTGVRLPNPFSVTVITSPWLPMISEITRCPLPSLTPRTPHAVRPIARTSDSLKRIAFPAEVNSMML